MLSHQVVGGQASPHWKVELEPPSLEYQHLWSQELHLIRAIEVEMGLILLLEEVRLGELHQMSQVPRAEPRINFGGVTFSRVIARRRSAKVHPLHHD